MSGPLNERVEASRTSTIPPQVRETSALLMQFLPHSQALALSACRDFNSRICSFLCLRTSVSQILYATRNVGNNIIAAGLRLRNQLLALSVFT